MTVGAVLLLTQLQQLQTCMYPWQAKAARTTCLGVWHTLH